MLYTDSEAFARRVRQRIARLPALFMGIAAVFIVAGILWSTRNPRSQGWAAAGILIAAWVAYLIGLFVPIYFTGQGTRVTDSHIDPPRRGLGDALRRHRRSIPVPAVERVEGMTSRGVHGYGIVWRKGSRWRFEMIWAPEVEDFRHFVIALQRVLPGKVPSSEAFREGSGDSEVDAMLGNYKPPS